MWYLTCFIFCAILEISYGVSTKMDFGNDEEVTATNSSKVEDKDVEVKHTIVVSTKLKNNNRRGLHAPSDVSGDGILTYSVGTPKDKDSGEVPIVPGFKSIESTRIRTPDSRFKPHSYPDVLINRNIRDELDVVPNLATNPMQWKPSNHFNNINWWSPEMRPQSNFGRRNDRPFIDNRINRKITNDGMKEFYCRKCRELSVPDQTPKGCIQQRSNPWIYQTTPKMKLDGKLAKLN